jgi:hypothetical protein
MKTGNNAIWAAIKKTPLAVFLLQGVCFMMNAQELIGRPGTYPAL